MWKPKHKQTFNHQYEHSVEILKKMRLKTSFKPFTSFMRITILIVKSNKFYSNNSHDDLGYSKAEISLTISFLEDNLFYDFNVNVLNKYKNSLPIVVVKEVHILAFEHPIFHLSWSVQHQVTICSWYLPIHG